MAVKVCGWCVNPREPDPACHPNGQCQHIIQSTQAEEFVIISDDDGHHYVCPADKSSEAYTALEAIMDFWREDREGVEPELPTYLVEVGGAIGRVQVQAVPNWEMSMACIIINGNRIDVSGNADNISIVNGTITVGDVVVSSDLKGIVRVEWSGPLASLKCDAPVNVSGNVAGDVKAEGPVNCGAVTGSVKAEGPVNCGSVGGSVKASGPVIHR